MNKKKSKSERNRDYQLPEGRYRFGGIYGDLEKSIVKKLGGPSKAIKILCEHYIETIDEYELRERRKLAERKEKLRRVL